MNRLVRLYTGFQFFFGLLLWLPVFYEYQRRMGLSAAEIFEIQSIYQVIFCFLEIPTGWFADRYGYLRSLKFGAFVLIIANVLPVFVVDYAGFLAHFVLIAAARSFISGASSAYLYEALRDRGDAELYKSIEGRARSWGLVGKVVCWAGVGAMMEWHVTLPYWLTALASLFALAFAFLLPGLAVKGISGSSDAKEPAGAAVWGALRLVASERRLPLLMLQGVALFVLARVVQVTLFQPILDSKQIPIAWHGTVMSAMTLFEAFGSWRPDLARRWFSDVSAVTWLTVLVALSQLALPFIGGWGTLVSLCVFSLAIGWSFPLQRQVMNDAISMPRYRATILSIESISDRSVSALVTLLLARFVASGSMTDFLAGSALLTILIMFVIAWLLFRKPAASDKLRQ